MWTRVLADALYAQWRRAHLNAESTSLVGRKNANAVTDEADAAEKEGSK